MNGFEPVTLSWKDEDFTVPARSQLMLIAKIEDALAGDTGDVAIDILFRRKGPPHSRLAAAYGAALRYAGAKVTDEEVYLSIHEDIASASRAQVAAKIQAMIVGLLAVISPPVTRAIAVGPAEKKA